MTPADMRMAQVHGRLYEPPPPPARARAGVGALVGAYGQTRRRIDYRWLPDGRVRATVTVVLPNGQVFRSEGTAGAEDLPAEAFRPRPEVGATSTDKVTDPYHRMRVSYLFEHGRPAASTEAAERWWMSIGKDRRGDFKLWYAVMLDKRGAPLHSDNWSRHIAAWKGLSRAQRGRLKNDYTPGVLEDIATGLKDVATSDAFRSIAAGIAMAAPALGPLAPAALGVAGAMGTASTLAAAHGSEVVGAVKTAEDLVGLATREAEAIAPGNPQALLEEANATVKRATGRTTGRTTPKPKPKPTPKGIPKGSKPLRALVKKTRAIVRKGPSSSSSSGGSVAERAIAAAKGGRLKSTTRGAVTPAQLLAAAEAGRVFVVA